MTYLCFTQCLKEKRNHFTIHHCDSLNSIWRKKNQFDHLCLSLSLFLRTMLEQKIWTENHKLPAITSDSRALLTTYGKCPDKLFFSTTWCTSSVKIQNFFLLLNGGGYTKGYYPKPGRIMKSRRKDSVGQVIFPTLIKFSSLADRLWNGF